MKDVAFAGTESGFDFLRCRRAMTGTVALGVTIFSVGVAAAQDPFAVNITVDASSVTQTNDNLEDFISLFSNAELAALVPSYIDDFSPADFTLDFRGLPATASYALGSTDLVLEIPAADINETFTGATRDDSEDAFFEFLEGNGEEILTRLLQALARETPIDPYAGNPSSLVGRSITADFGIGRFNLSNAAGAGPGRNGVGGEGSPPNLFSLGFQFGHYTPRGTPSTSELGGREYEVNTFTLPINYVRAVGDSGFALVFDAPLTYIDTGGAVSGSASFAFGVQAPLCWRNGKPFAGVAVSPAVGPRPAEAAGSALLLQDAAGPRHDQVGLGASRQAARGAEPVGALEGHTPAVGLALVVAVVRRQGIALLVVVDGVVADADPRRQAGKAGLTVDGLRLRVAGEVFDVLEVQRETAVGREDRDHRRHQGWSNAPVGHAV